MYYQFVKMYSFPRIAYAYKNKGRVNGNFKADKPYTICCCDLDNQLEAPSSIWMCKKNELHWSTGYTSFFLASVVFHQKQNDSI